MVLDRFLRGPRPRLHRPYYTVLLYCMIEYLSVEYMWLMRVPTRASSSPFNKINKQNKGWVWGETIGGANPYEG